MGRDEAGGEDRDVCSIWNRSHGTRKLSGKHPLDGEIFRNKNKVWYHCIVASQECPEKMGQVVIEGEHSALEDEGIVRGKAHDGAFEK